MKVFRHPYSSFSPDHKHLGDTPVKIPAYSLLATPYRWMLSADGDGAAATELGHKQLPPDKPAFPTPWVYSKERQEILLNEAFGRVAAGRLVFLYCKDGHPLSDASTQPPSRLLIGVGRIREIFPVTKYRTISAKQTYPLWDRIIKHSIRPNGGEGFLFPYHDYLELPIPTEERTRLMTDFAVVPETSRSLDFSYGAEFMTADASLAVLLACLDSIRKVQNHHLVPGPWDQRIDWLNRCIGECWKERGAFPGLGAALEAFGLRNGTAFVFELTRTGALKAGDNPWPLLDALLSGRKPTPIAEYAADLQTVRSQWKVVEAHPERRNFLQLLARFALTPSQAKRWYSPYHRPLTDREILENPYLVSELDEGGKGDDPISVSTIDRGVLPDKEIAGEFPLEAPTRLETPQDWRRARAALRSVLKRAADKGDTLLKADEAVARVAAMRLSLPLQLGPEWIEGHQSELADSIKVLTVARGALNEQILAVQLGDMNRYEATVRSVLSARALAPTANLNIDWMTEVQWSIDSSDVRAAAVRAERAECLARCVSRRLGVLTGGAGTGKTTLCGILATVPQLAAGGVLMLAPTGKARVRLTRAVSRAQSLRGAGLAGARTAKTVAQFLSQQNRYNGELQKPLVRPDLPKYQQEKTIIIDEASMLTTADLAAVLDAVDLAHAQRIILVGDPNQLPPIGAGRPFVDLIEFLRTGDTERAKAMGTLQTETRSTPGSDSATLRLAAWFTHEPPPAGAENIFLDLEVGKELNDLELALWSTPGELTTQLEAQLTKQLSLTDPGDVPGFDKFLGLVNGSVDFHEPNGAELFQILSPVRMKSHGVLELNRWVQRRFRSTQLSESREKYGVSLGDEEIVHKDKVIQLLNEKRDGYRHTDTAQEEHLLANGEIGLVGPKMQKGKTLRVVFVDRPDWTYLYEAKEFPAGSGPLQLAYALTVHKAQGSDFGTVFFVLPKGCSLASRELLYTALTRSRGRMVLLVEGHDTSELHALSRPENSDTAGRSTNLFRGGLRHSEGIPYAEHLVHRLGNKLFQSKSELVIASELENAGLPIAYALPLEGTITGGRVHPDFRFETPAGDLLLWEHLGMMGDPHYSRGWAKKVEWYTKNGYHLGQNLFTTQEVGGLDLGDVRAVIREIQKRLT